VISELLGARGRYVLRGADDARLCVYALHIVSMSIFLITPLLPEGERRDDVVATLIEIEYTSMLYVHCTYHLTTCA
jgi:hypothetical protein